ncbi:hypothetical protein EVAR_28230_1 [Eumeta japonica]|uniref:Mos1 transposase HTH domain-containing protein n=1 Tax=Eumeta variegata TaxID=151549 RepID=A0A4C1V736_EUMVA|nr:hypothetical protein EVAR_28230_1 [Eumeta japonica]
MELYNCITYVTSFNFGTFPLRSNFKTIKFFFVFYSVPRREREVLISRLKRESLERTSFESWRTSKFRLQSKYLQAHANEVLGYNEAKTELSFYIKSKYNAGCYKATDVANKSGHAPQNNALCGPISNRCGHEGYNSVSVREAQNWFKRFQFGKFDVKDEPPSGGPVKVKVDDILEKVELDWHISSYNIAE